MKNIPYILAGVILLGTACLHTVGGQLALVDPMLASNLDLQVKSELQGAWHLVTVLLFVMGIIVLRIGLKPKMQDLSLIKVMAVLNLLFALVFVVITIIKPPHAPQYILFFPIAFFLFFGLRKQVAA